MPELSEEFGDGRLVLEGYGGVMLEGKDEVV